MPRSTFDVKLEKSDVYYQKNCPSLLTLSSGDKVSILTHIYPYKFARKIKSDQINSRSCMQRKVCGHT